MAVAPQLSGTFTDAGGRPATGTTAPVAAPAAKAAAPNPYSPQAQAFYQALDNNKYIDAFNTSLANERSMLDTHVNQALGELGQRRDAAAQVVAGLPSQIASSYGMASGNVGSTQGVAQAGLSSDVKGAVPGLAAPYQNALKVNETAGQNLAPFLNLGMMANYQSGAAGIRQQQLAGEQDIAHQQQQFQLQQMHDKVLHEQTQQDQNAQWQHQMDWLQNPNNPDSIAGRTTLANSQNKAALAAQPSADARLAGSGLTEGDVQTIRNSPEYTRLSAEISKGKDTSMNPQQLVNILTGKGAQGQKLLMLLQKENPSFFGKGGGKQLTHAGQDSESWYYSPLLSGFNARTIPRDLTGG